ncbi:MAG: SUF system NifU family Fe-S cluster assembly protein [Candidatus Babeliales bacterium]
MNLYREILMDHYRHPRNRGQLEKPDFSSGQFNPSCGDQVSFEGMVNNDIITQVKFTGKGCVISQASASLLSELIEGKSIEDALALNKEDMQKLIGMQLGPMRLKCALLPLEALQQGLQNYKKSL